MGAIDDPADTVQDGPMRTRLTPEERRSAIFTAALTVYRRDGLTKLLRDRVATEAGTSAGLVSRYWQPFSSLVEAVIEAAHRP